MLLESGFAGFLGLFGMAGDRRRGAAEGVPTHKGGPTARPPKGKEGVEMSEE